MCGEDLVSWLSQEKVIVADDITSRQIHQHQSHVFSPHLPRRYRHHDQGGEERGRVCDQRGEDVDHQRHPGRLDVSPGQHQRRAPAQEQVAHLSPHEPAR